MNGISEIWNQSINLCKVVLDVATAMVPGVGGGSKGKEALAASPLVPVAECTCAKALGSKGLTHYPSLFASMAPGARSMVRLAGLSGALAVGLGAYGAHVIMMNENLPEAQKHSYRTANMYHFVGTFGMVAASLGNRPVVTGILMATGTVFFSGSCYAYGLTGDNRVKKFAPFGGITLVLAWLSLIL